MPPIRSTFLLCLLSCGLLAAENVRFDKEEKIFLFTSKRSSYAFGIDENRKLRHLYWGGPLQRTADLHVPKPRKEMSSFDPPEMLENEEYPGWGGRRFDEPALKVTLAGGVRDLVLRYVSHRQDAHGVHVHLRDIALPIEVELHYRMDDETGIVERSATIRNGTREPITIESAQSAAWYLPKGTGYRLSYLSGRWAAETQLQQEFLAEGVKVLESRTGHTGHNINPWFAIDAGDADERHGRVWFGALAWSGNWRISVEQTPYRQVRVTGGYNSFDFSYLLKPNESLETPAFYVGVSDGGYGEASRLLHERERRIMPGGKDARLRPVIYNSWEATTFNVDEQGQTALAEKAARFGAELFVVDDGWFGARNDDHAGLGDWIVNPRKFPSGLKGLIDSVHRNGMEFGLWFEPEMVNPNSDLYRAHPDWAMNFPGRPRSELRNQLVLNLARNDVRDYLLGVLDRLVSENDIRYIKWDMNRIFSEPGWPEVAPAEQKTLWVKYVDNLYYLFDQLRTRHPKLEFESCSGGGGRVDLGILRRVEEFWTSDNTEALDRIGIQEGFTQGYAPRLMSAWVTDVPGTNGRSTPLQFRFVVAMQGALGIGGNLNKWTDEENALAKNMVALYKQIRPTIQNGQLYRLLSMRKGDTAANEYVSTNKKQAVLFAMRHSQQYTTPPPLMRLEALDRDAVYRLKPLAEQHLPDPGREFSGAYLMEHGLQLELKGDYDSTIVVLDREQ